MSDSGSKCEILRNFRFASMNGHHQARTRRAKTANVGSRSPWRCPRCGSNSPCSMFCFDAEGRFGGATGAGTVAPHPDEKVGLRLRPTPRSADRARSLARVSEKREYFKCRPETIGDFAPKVFKLGV